MAYSVRIVLRKYKPNSMGYHILQLCVTKNSSRKRISLKLYVDPAYWDNSAERLTIERNLKGEKQREANKKRIQDNAFLDKVKARAREIIEKFEIDGIDWTLNQFEETFLNPLQAGQILRIPRKPYSNTAGYRPHGQRQMLFRNASTAQIL